MAKHYEALQRAEAERRRKVAGSPLPAAPTEWDTTPSTARSPRSSLAKRLFASIRRNRGEVDTSNEINKRRISILQPESFAAEQFRTLRGRIDSLATQQPIKSVALVSANADEGKSMAAINLAVVTSMSVGRKVLLVDCDLRRPKIHRSLGVEPRVGLGEVLSGDAQLEDAIVQVDAVNMDVLPVRTRPGNPSELLASVAMRQLLEKTSELYDQVILDTPACLGLPDAKTVSELCDGVVLVVRADSTPRQDVEAVLEVLDQRQVLGLVLNGADLGPSPSGYY